MAGRAGTGSKNQMDGRRVTALDIAGKRYGYLEPLYPTSGRQNDNTIWMCKCHACGRVVPVKRSNITRTAQKCQVSCGCLIGKEPERGGTHINRIKQNTVATNSKTGINGVTRDSDKRFWRARLDYYGKRYEIRHLPNIYSAAIVRRSLELEVMYKNSMNCSERLASWLKSEEFNLL